MHSQSLFNKWCNIFEQNKSELTPKLTRENAMVELSTKVTKNNTLFLLLLLLKIYWRLTNNKIVYFRHQLVWSVTPVLGSSTSFFLSWDPLLLLSNVNQSLITNVYLFTRGGRLTWTSFFIGKLTVSKTTVCFKCPQIIYII